MADNLEVSLFGQRFEVAHVGRPLGGGDPVDLVGRHCESGDLLSSRRRAARPARRRPARRAGHRRLLLHDGNNYNGARRPPVVFVRDGDARVVVRREGYEDLLRLDV